jgi:hypothetical protein
VSGLSSVLFPNNIPFKSGCSEAMRDNLHKKGLLAVENIYYKIKNQIN